MPSIISTFGETNYILLLLCVSVVEQNTTKKKMMDFCSGDFNPQTAPPPLRQRRIISRISTPIQRFLSELGSLWP